MISHLQADVTMSDLFEVLHEDDDLLVINKPAGLVCHPTKGDEHSSLAGRIRLYLGADRPVHLINRLDREKVMRSRANCGPFGKNARCRKIIGPLCMATWLKRKG